MEAIRAIRNLRAEMNVAASKRTRLLLLPADGWGDALMAAAPHFKKLAGASDVELVADRAAITEKTAGAICPAAEILIPLGDLVDVDKEIARLEKERESLQKEIGRSRGMLKNEGFLSKAPEALVAQEKAKLETGIQMEKTLEERIAAMKEMLK